MTPFKYSRKKEVAKKDSQGNPIPLLMKVKDKDGNDVDEAIPGKFETELIWRTDYINLDLFIRTHELDDNRVIVLLRDGHDETQKVPVSLKNEKKPATPNNVNYEKQTVWVQSEITLEKPEEIERLYKVLDFLGDVLV